MRKILLLFVIVGSMQADSETVVQEFCKETGPKGQYAYVKLQTGRKYTVTPQTELRGFTGTFDQIRAGQSPMVGRKVRLYILKGKVRRIETSPWVF